MKLKLSAIALLAMIMPAQALTDGEATFIEQLVTAATVLERRCTGYEVNGSGSVQLGAQLLGSPDAAMAMIAAFDAAIKAHDGTEYNESKFRPDVFEAARKTANRIMAAMMKNEKAACAEFGDAGVAHGVLRRF